MPACYDASMKKQLANPSVNKAEREKMRSRLALAAGSHVASGKEARRAAFGKAVSQMSAAEAVSRAKLISEVDPAAFRIVRMPG